MAGNISEDEVQQLLRTVEMFEAITQSQPNDYQSLEILKEAYTKLDRRDESLAVSKRLARMYAEIGQISQAILEYEGILQEYPDDQAVRATLTELEARTSSRTGPLNSGVSPVGHDSKPTPPAPTLAVAAGAPPPFPLPNANSDGDQALADVLIAEKLLTRQAALPLLQRLKTDRPASIIKGQPLTLVQLVADDQIAKLEDILLVLTNKSGLPYMPLSVYDVDRDVAFLLPRETSFHFCVVPFDMISRSVLVAVANPFDEDARDQVRSMLNYNIFWYVAPASEIVGALRRVHGVEANAKKS